MWTNHTLRPSYGGGMKSVGNLMCGYSVKVLGSTLVSSCRTSFSGKALVTVIVDNYPYSK